MSDKARGKGKWAWVLRHQQSNGQQDVSVWGNREEAEAEARRLAGPEAEEDTAGGTDADREPGRVGGPVSRRKVR